MHAVCDIQDRFRDVIHDMPLLTSSAARAVRACKELGVPILVTEQYPKALGSTVSEISQHLPSGGEEAIAKTRFSMVVPELEEKLAAIESRKQVMLCGLETHVCIFQTARDLLNRGYEVHLLVDAISR